MTQSLVSIPQADARAYQASLAGVSFHDDGAAGRIWMRDRDRAALLHRLSTNQIEQLQPGQGTRTVLSTPIGRIIDLLHVYCLDDGLLLVTSPGNGPAIFRHLRKNIFFNDKVTLEDASGSLGQLTLYGPQAAALLARLGLPGANLPLHGIAVAAWNAAQLYVARAMPLGGDSFTLYAPSDSIADLRAALGNAGACELDADSYAVLRAEAGYGSFGRELSTEYIPLETGLWDAISFSKGCYVGQEIIARMESRGRLAKQLRGLRFANGLPAELSLPTKLSVAGKESGDLTSVVDSPRYGLIGLAYVRTAHAAPGTIVGVGEVTAEVVELPFE